MYDDVALKIFKLVQFLTKSHYVQLNDELSSLSQTEGFRNAMAAIEVKAKDAASGSEFIYTRDEWKPENPEAVKKRE